MCVYNFTVPTSLVINVSIFCALAAKWCCTETLHMSHSTHIQISPYQLLSWSHSSRARSGWQVLYSPELHVPTGKSRLIQVKNYKWCLYHQAAKWREAAGVICGNYVLKYVVHQSAYMSKTVYIRQSRRNIGRVFIFNCINKYWKGIFRNKEMWDLDELFKVKSSPFISKATENWGTYCDFFSLKNQVSCISTSLPSALCALPIFSMTERFLSKAKGISASQ